MSNNVDVTLHLGRPELAALQALTSAVVAIGNRVPPPPPADPGLLERLVDAVERIADAFSLPDQPPGHAAGPLIIVERGARIDFAMANEIPLGKEGVQHFRPADYDGPISAEVTTGNGSVTPEGDTGDDFRVSPVDGVAVGDVVSVRYRADERHGPGELWSEDVVDYSVIAADAAPLTEAGFEVVDKAAAVEPAPTA